MHPVVFQINEFAIHTYGLFVALGVLAGVFFAKFEARRTGLAEEKILDLCFYIIMAAIVASRIFYVATFPSHFISHPLEIFMIWKGGLVFYGGFIGAVAAALLYVRIQHLPLGKCADIAGLSIPLGHFLGRLGCFFAGCCYGKACDLPWAVTFSHPESLAPLHTAIHPTQLYHSAGNLAIFLLLFSMRRKKRFDGQIFWLYVLLYGIVRSVIEVFRGDARGGMIPGSLSVSQGIGLSLAAVAAFVLLILWKRKKSLTDHDRSQL
ncbi:MAG: prolipoprotein diacylglyceryl transferase [Desulfosalsimonadaceae bacterium]